MVLNFGMLQNGLFPQTEADGAGLNGDPNQVLVNELTTKLIEEQAWTSAATTLTFAIPNRKRILVVIDLEEEGGGGTVTMTWNGIATGYDYLYMGCAGASFTAVQGLNQTSMVCVKGTASGGGGARRALAHLYLNTLDAQGTINGIMTRRSDDENYVITGAVRTGITNFTSIVFSKTTLTFSGTIGVYALGD